MRTIAEKNMKLLKSASNEDYITVLVKKENGNYSVLTKNIGNNEYNVFYRSFKTLEQATKHFERLA